MTQVKQAVGRFIAWFIVWRRFVALVAVLWLVRGAMLLAVLPPFEGWDEYQHLAYIQHLEETGSVPVLGETLVPRSLYPDLRRYPHSDDSLRGLGVVGAVSYRAYWQRCEEGAIGEITAKPGGSASTPDATIPLYQAQHPPLYYWLASRVDRLLSRDVLVRVAVLRAVNVLFGAATVGAIGWLLGRMLADQPLRYPVLVLAASQPLYLLNFARIANDGLAVFLGTAAIALLLAYGSTRPMLIGLLAGMLLDLAVLAKATSLSLVAFGIGWFVILAARRELDLRAAVSAMILLASAAFSASAWSFVFNARHYGMLVPMQEALINQRAGRTFADFLHAAWSIDWWQEYSRRYFRHSLWIGGWSFLKPLSLLVRAQQVLFLLAFLGVIRRSIPFLRRRGNGAIDSRFSLGCSLVSMVVAVSLSAHMLQTKTALGAVGTNIWYAAASFPFLLILATWGWQGLADQRWAVRFAWSLVGVFLLVEWHGLFFRMIPRYTDSHSLGRMYSRLAALHPPGFGSAWIVGLSVVQVALLALTVAVSSKAVARLPVTEHRFAPASSTLFEMLVRFARRLPWPRTRLFCGY